MQKEYGLKSVQEEYFNSILIYNNYFIFPGGKLILSLILLSTLLKLIIDKIKKVGTFIIHIGIIFFIISAFFSLKEKDEKYILIKEGESNNILINNNLYQLKILNNKTQKTEYLDLKNIKKNRILQLKNVKLKMKISNFSQNSNFKINKNFKKEFFILEKIPYFVENEYNKTSIKIDLIDEKNTTIKKIILIDNLIKKKYIKINEYDLKISLKKKKEKLPFNIYLEKFEKIKYKGTNSAKSFESQIILKDRNIEWKYKIKMNKPLTYKNYKLYQSSFIENDINTTILYVSKNSNSKYIYMSCIIILIGFVLHINNLILKKSKINE